MIPTNLSATSNITQLIPSGALDIVGVYTQDFKQVFSKARPVKIIVKPPNKVMEHPTETGSTVTDDVVTLPKKIELSLILTSGTYKTAYEEIAQLSNQRTLLTVQCRAGVFKNMIIEDYSHQEDSDLYDALTLGLKLSEVLFFTPQYAVVPRNPANNSTQGRGNVQTSPATADQESSVFKKGLDYFKGTR